MNEILQKRIDIESNKYMEEAIEMNSVVGDNLHYEDLKTCFIEAADFALQNQWISVDEALPKESGDYLVIVKQSSDSEAYFHEISTYNATDNIWFYVGKLIVTHWAPIPSLKGGEK